MIASVLCQADLPYKSGKTVPLSTHKGLASKTGTGGHACGPKYLENFESSTLRSVSSI